MFDRFDVWQFRDDANCWDFVRCYLVSVFGVPESAVPKYGIAPSDKLGMTRASKEVSGMFVDSKPVDGSVACHYIGRVITHVGVVHDGKVRHTSRQWGTVKNSIAEFERLAPTTKYKIYANS